MPTYVFQCLNCDEVYEDLVPWDEKGRWPGVKCPGCKSAKKRQRPTTCGAVIFANPRGTSKADSFTYVAGWNMENAKETRRRAEAKSHMGASPYNNIDDVSSGRNEDFGKI